MDGAVSVSEKIPEAMHDKLASDNVSEVIAQNIEIPSKDGHWFDYIDAYCERVDPSFWAEPVNAITNAAFLIAAFMVWRKYRMLPHSRQGILLQMLIMTMVLIGMGSFMFHTVATRWAMMADVLPITLFIYLAFALYLRDVFALSKLKVVGGVLAYMAVSGATYNILPHDALNGSLMYAPALAIMAGMAFVLYRMGHKVTAHYLTMASVIFIFSVTLRTLDMALCSTLDVGVHFMWHVLNSVVLYYVLMGLISNTRWLAEKDGVNLH